MNSMYQFFINEKKRLKTEELTQNVKDTSGVTLFYRDRDDEKYMQYKVGDDVLTVVFEEDQTQRHYYKPSNQIRGTGEPLQTVYGGLIAVKDPTGKVCAAIKEAEQYDSDFYGINKQKVPEIIWGLSLRVSGIDPNRADVTRDIEMLYKGEGKRHKKRKENDIER